MNGQPPRAGLEVIPLERAPKRAWRPSASAFFCAHTLTAYILSRASLINGIETLFLAVDRFASAPAAVGGYRRDVLRRARHAGLTVEAAGLHDAALDYCGRRVRHDNRAHGDLAGESHSENKDCRSGGY